MSLSEHFDAEIHPIDIVEDLAEHRAWDFDRLGEDQIAMAVEGSWRTYALTLAWTSRDETLRLIATFDMDPPSDRLAALHGTLNLANDMIWTGAFSHWAEQKLMVFRYGLLLSGGQVASPEQIDGMIGAAVAAAERFYPAFQLAVWGEAEPRDAVAVAINEAYGRA